MKVKYSPFDMEFGNFTQIAKIRVPMKHINIVGEILLNMDVKVDKLSCTRLMIGIPREKPWEFSVGYLKELFAKLGVEIHILSCRIIGVPIISALGEVNES